MPGKTNLSKSTATKMTSPKTSAPKQDIAPPKSSKSLGASALPAPVVWGESGAVSTVTVPASRPKEISPGLYSVILDHAKVEELAYLVSIEGRTWDECAWRLAELETQLGPAYGADKNVFAYGGLPDQVLLNPSKVLKSPREEDVRSLAFDISQRGPSLQDLHWFIAQRQFIWNLLPTLG